MSAMLKPQLSQDRGYIGGGNIAGILGLSPFKTPLDEYLTITGQADAPSAEDEIFFARRKALEPFAADAFQQKTGVQIVLRNERYVDSLAGFLRAEIDFETSDDRNGETKTVQAYAAKYWGPDGTDECPVYVTAQAMWGLGFKPSRKYAYVHALVGLDEDRIYLIERDDVTIAAMREKAIAFWNSHVLTGVAPDPVTLDDALRLFPEDRGNSIEADAEMLILLNELREKDQALKSLEKDVAAMKDRARIYMGEHASLCLEGKPLATWKAQQSRRFDQAAFAAEHPELFEQFKQTNTTRVFRLK